MGKSKVDGAVGLAPRKKFRATSRALRASFEAELAGGRHTYEKGMRHEQVLIDFLARHLPPRYGVSRGEVVDSLGGVARQCDVVVYDAEHAPLLQQSEASRVFPAESVYATIELKPRLDARALETALEVVRTVKQLDRSAVVAKHGGHRRLAGPKGNPPIFAAVFALDSTDVERSLVPEVMRLHDRRMPRLWADAVCVLDEALIYHFVERDDEEGGTTWVPTVLCDGARLGCYYSGEDTLFLFYLFLLQQLTVRELFPPDLLRYVEALRFGEARIYTLGTVGRGLSELWG